MKTFFERAAEIAGRQNFKEFYSRAFSGKISPYLAAALTFTRVTPNQVTLAMIPSGLIGGLLFSLGTPLGFILGGLCFVLLNILDAADGELARYTARTSLFGDYLDRVAHYATNSAAVVGLGIGLYFQTNTLLALYCMLALEIALVLDDALRDLLVTCGIDKLNEQGDNRKSTKAATSLSAGAAARWAWRGFFSNVALFHLVPLFAVLDVALRTHLVFGYFLLFTVVAVLKVAFRVRTIARHVRTRSDPEYVVERAA